MVSLNFVFFYENFTKISQHDSKSRFFLSGNLACWSGFGIFKRNRDNSDEIGMVGQSADRLSDEQEMLVQARPARFSVFSVVTAIIS